MTVCRPLTSGTQGAATAALFFCCALAAPVAAADSDGSFAIKGAGLQSCKAYLEAANKAPTDLHLYAGWIDGYVTALNQFQPDTFDILPWQNTQSALGLMQSVCAQLPEDTRFMDAFHQLNLRLKDQRLTKLSDATAFRTERGMAVIYKSVYQMMLDKLVDGDFLHVAQRGDDAAVSDALSAFQNASGLTVTGLPDQPTLFQMFYKTP
jgi:peptidoglycan hydrolase-like protein with peptidoglycan-binding domain